MLRLEWIAVTIFSLLLLVATVQLVRQRKLREEHALLWMLATIAIFILSIIPGAIRFVGTLFDVSYAPAIVLVLGLLFVIGILLSHSVSVTGLSDKNRDLAQSLALLEWRLHQSEQRLAQLSKPPVTSEEVVQPTHNGNSATNGTMAHDLLIAPARQRTTGAPPPNRVLVVGLDGGTFDLIEPWVDQGYLPNLGRIMRDGAWGRLRSVVPPITAPAWSSFGTGTNPGKHGLYDWIARRSGSYEYSPVTAMDLKAPTIYSLLSQLGRRVCVQNVPMTYPPIPVNGVMVSGLPAPSTNVPITHPTSLLDDIVKTVGDYILYPDPGQAYSDAGVDAFLERLARTTDLRIKSFDYLRGREKWDFSMVVFNGTDTVSHAMWKFMDQSHPLHEPAKEAKYGTAIRDCYQTMDAYLGQVIDGLDDDTTLLVMSDHGFGPFHKFIHVNNWLIQKGYMRLRPGPLSRIKAGLFGLGFSPMNVYDVMMRLGLGAFKREVVRGQGQGLLKALFLSFEDVDWSRTRAYSLGNIGQVNLNVLGREPFGCVEPGEEYERVRAEIIAELRELRDPQTDEFVVETIYRREEIYQGDELAKAPDILFIPRRLEYFGFGEYEFGSHRIIESMRRGISGTHRMDGIFLAYGRAVRPGLHLSGARIVDLAPTIMALMGEAVPDHMDGRVLEEAFHELLPVAKGPPKRVERNAETPDSDGIFTDEEKDLLAERLRSLGYVG